jgi:transcriptional antiterminator RfaH
MFGGYLFLLGSHEDKLMTLTTNRVSKILDVDDQDRLCRDLLQVHQLIEAGAPMTIEQQLEKGQPVRIKSGPLRGLEGKIVERRGKTRLLVVVEYIQQGVSVDIDDFMIEAA